MAGLRAPALSPDGRRVAFMSHENESWDIWTLDLDRGTRMRLRVKCATLAWHTLRAALEDRRDTITTE